jgi:glycosyltransferase involved in cell wall biosynthesis
MIKDGVTGRLVDFFDVTAWSDRLTEVLANPGRQHPLRDAARRLVRERYDLRSVCLPKQVALLTRLSRS